MSRPRVGIVGARRRRQGLGPFVARDLAAAGAEVACFLVTREEHLDEARDRIAALAGVSPRGYVDLEEMLARESLDALAICSPAEVHATALDAAVRAGLHVLCEKPLVWSVLDLAGRAGQIAADFEARGLLLWENCVWPYTLPAFDRLHPDARENPPARFAMHLEPASRGLQSLGDALSHPLSLLQALLPGERLEDVRFSTHDPHATSLTVRFRYRSGAHGIDAEVRLDQNLRQPRRAGYVIDGCEAERLVAPAEGYRLSFAASGRVVPLPDPLTLLVEDFVAALSAERGAAARSRGREIVRRMELLATVVAAYAPE